MRRASSNEYEAWESLKEALKTIDAVEVWYQCSEEACKLIFDEDVINVAESGVLNNWEYTDKYVEIIKKTDITDYNKPVWCFYYIGIDAEKKTYLLEKNNTNTTRADRLRAQYMNWKEIREYINDKDDFKNIVKSLIN